MVQRGFLHILFLSALGVLAADAAGQSSQTERQNFSVEGTVVNSATGEAIRGALVQGFAGRQIAVLTGADGKFRLEKVPAGQLVLTTDKPGYFSEQDLSNGLSFTGFTVGPDMPPVVLRLVPEGIIYGRVSNEDGGPAENTPVKVVSFQTVGGRKQKQVAAAGNTNSEGEYRVASLRPGLYYVLVGPKLSTIRKKDSKGQAREEGAAGEFYPGVTDFSAATPIPIVPGTLMRADVSLSAWPYFEISGLITGTPQGAAVAVFLIDSVGDHISAGYRFDAKTGAFQMVRVPGGPYTLICQTTDSAGRMFIAQRTLSLQSDVTGLHMAMVPAVDLPVRIHVSGGTQSTPVPGLPSLSLMLRPAQDSLAMQTSAISAEGGEERPSYVMRNVLPGAYRAEIGATGAEYVEYARCGSTDLLRDNLTVVAGLSCAIEIGLRGDGATLQATITTAQFPAQAFVLLHSENREIQILPVFPQSNATGELANLAPGEYKALAVDRMDDLEYLNTAVMEPLLAKAQDVVLRSGEKTPLTLELIRRKP